MFSSRWASATPTNYVVVPDLDSTVMTIHITTLEAMSVPVAEILIAKLAKKLDIASGVFGRTIVAQTRREFKRVGERFSRTSSTAHSSIWSILRTVRRVAISPE